MLLKMALLTFGEVNLLTHALVMLSGDVLEAPRPVETTWTQFNPLDSEASTLSTSSMVELKLELSFQRETGFGQPSGSFQRTMLTVNGQHLVRLISLNQEVTVALEPQEEVNLSEPLFIGDQTTTMMLMRKLHLNTSTLSLSETTSMFMDLTGVRMVSYLPLMVKRSWISHSTKTCGLKADSQMVCPTHGEVKQKKALHLTSHIILSSTSPLVAP